MDGMESYAEEAFEKKMKKKFPKGHTLCITDIKEIEAWAICIDSKAETSTVVAYSYICLELQVCFDENFKVVSHHSKRCSDPYWLDGSQIPKEARDRFSRLLAPYQDPNNWPEATKPPKVLINIKFG